MHTLFRVFKWCISLKDLISPIRENVVRELCERLVRYEEFMLNSPAKLSIAHLAAGLKGHCPLVSQVVAPGRALSSSASTLTVSQESTSARARSRKPGIQSSTCLFNLDTHLENQNVKGLLSQTNVDDISGGQPKTIARPRTWNLGKHLMFPWGAPS